MLRGHLDVRGPSTAEDLARATALRAPDVTLALIRLENEGFALRGHFTRSGRSRGVLRPAGTDPHPRVHQAAEAARGRAGHVPGLHAVPAALAACHPGYPAGRHPRRALGGRAAAGLRARGRGLGEGHLPGAGDRVPPGVAGRGVPGRRHRVGPAIGPRRAGRSAPPRRLDSFPGHPGHADDPRRPAVAAAGGPRRPAPRGTRTGQHQRRDRGTAGSRRAVPTGPGDADRAAAQRGRGGAVGRRGPRADHGGRLSRRAVAVRPPRRAERPRPAPAPPRQPAQQQDGRPVVPAARTTGRLRPGRPGRSRRRAASRPLGRRVPRPAGPGEPRRALARGAVGTAADGGPRHDQRRAVRRRVQRRAVRPPRRGGHAARDQETAADRGDDRAVRGRPAEPDRHRAARPAYPGARHELRQLHRRRRHRGAEPSCTHEGTWIGRRD